MRNHTGYDPFSGSGEIAISAANRRSSERHAAAEDQAWIGWWEGRLFRKSPATLVDISQGGSKLVAEYPPPRRSAIWICVAGRHTTEWIEGEALEVSRQPDNTAVVRVKFREVCPYAFFEVVVYGSSSGSDSAHWTREAAYRSNAY